MDVGLGFVAQPKIEGEIRPHLPVVADEGAEIDLASRDLRIPRVHAELGGAASELSDLRGRYALLLSNQCSPVAFDGTDAQRLAGAIERHCEASRKRERAGIVLRGDAGLRCSPHPNAESPRVRAAQHGGVVLEFVVVLRVGGVADGISAAVERAQNLKRGTRRVGLRDCGGAEILEACFVDDARCGVRPSP